MIAYNCSWKAWFDLTTGSPGFKPDWKNRDPVLEWTYPTHFFQRAFVSDSDTYAISLQGQGRSVMHEALPLY